MLMNFIYQLFVDTFQLSVQFQYLVIQFDERILVRESVVEIGYRVEIGVLKAVTHLIYIIFKSHQLKELIAYQNRS